MRALPHPAQWLTTAALSEHVIQRALKMVEIAMQHGNKQEAIEAITYAFQDTVQEPINAVSPIARLELDMRIIGILESRKITLVGHLLEMTLDDLLSCKSIGRKAATLIRLALRKAGMKLRQPMCHGVPKWAVDLKGKVA